MTTAATTSATDAIESRGGESVAIQEVELSDERLEAELITLASGLAAGTARWLLLVAEYDRREVWKSWECRSMAHWLAVHVGVSLVTARQYVLVAGNLVMYPKLREAFLAGKLSYSRVRAACRCLTPETESDVVELALHATAPQLERIAAGVDRARRRNDAESAERQFDTRFLRLSYDDDGTCVIHGRVPAETGTALVRALQFELHRQKEIAALQIGDASDDAGEIHVALKSPDQLRVDALLRLVEAGHAVQEIEFAVAKHGAKDQKRGSDHCDATDCDATDEVDAADAVSYSPFADATALATAGAASVSGVSGVSGAVSVSGACAGAGAAGIASASGANVVSGVSGVNGAIGACEGSIETGLESTAFEEFDDEFDESEHDEFFDEGLPVLPPPTASPTLGGSIHDAAASRSVKLGIQSKTAKPIVPGRFTPRSTPSGRFAADDLDGRLRRWVSKFEQFELARGRVRPLIVVHRYPSGDELENGPAIPAVVADRLRCESDTMTATHQINESGEHEIRLGNRRRMPTIPERRSLHERDQCCRVPGCGKRRNLHVHHMIEFSKGGPTTRINLVMLCGEHHRLVHDRGWVLSGNPNKGPMQLHPPGRKPLSVHDVDIEKLIADLHELAANSGPVTPRARGERFDLEYAVSVHLANEQAAEVRRSLESR